MIYMTKTNSGIRELVYISVFAALMTVCAWISVPGAVPFTMQTFAVFAAAGILGSRRGAAAVLVYILLGAVGIPVFSGFRGGIGVLCGTTGGYIIGFIISAFVTGLICEKLGRSYRVMIPAMLLGLVLCYAFGTAWYMLLYMKTKGAITVYAVLSSCVFNFIIPDIAKILLAAFTVKRISRLANRQR